MKGGTRLASKNEKELVEWGARLGALDLLIKSQATRAWLGQRLKGWLES